MDKVVEGSEGEELVIGYHSCIIFLLCLYIIFIWL